jgi:hypothetical protein
MENEYKLPEDFNSQIREFLQLKETKKVFNDTRVYYEIFAHKNYISAEDDFYFHKNMEWQMLVLKKVAETHMWELSSMKYKNYEYSCKIWAVGVFHGNSPEEATAKAIYEFVKWFNAINRKTTKNETAGI